MLFVFMAIFFVRNLMLPMVSDDIPYAFVWDGNDRGNLLDSVGTRERITSLGDIVRSQYSHYMTWGGRIIGIGLTQLFAWQGKGIFNVLNTLVFTALALLVFRVGTGKRLRELNGVYMFWILFALWFLIPDPFLTTLWMCGSCVFLWTAVIGLLFLLPYAMAYWKGDNSSLISRLSPLASCILMAFAGLCAGWAVETSAAVIDVITFFALIYFWRQHQLKPWMVVGFVFLCIGSAMLVLAPGETVRMELQAKYEYNPDLPPDMYWTPLMYAINLIECFLPVVLKQVPMLLLIAYYVWRLPKGQRWNKTTQFQAALVAADLLVMVILVFIPVISARAGFFPTIAALIASLSVDWRVLSGKFASAIPSPNGTAVANSTPYTLNSKLNKAVANSTLYTLNSTLNKAVANSKLYTLNSKLKRAFVAVSLVLWLATTSICLYTEWVLHQQWMARIDYINAHQDQDMVVVHQIELPAIADEMPYWWLFNTATWNTDVLAWGCDLEPWEQGSHNLMYAQYYGWKKVMTDGEDRRTTDNYPLLNKWFGKGE